jgi:hypothetical protein
MECAGIELAPVWVEGRQRRDIRSQERAVSSGADGSRATITLMRIVAATVALLFAACGQTTSGDDLGAADMAHGTDLMNGDMAEIVGCGHASEACCQGRPRFCYSTSSQSLECIGTDCTACGRLGQPCCTVGDACRADSRATCQDVDGGQRECL